MTILTFKELGKFGKDLQVLDYKKKYRANELPVNNKKEIVFIGKSNVGKSSLINTLLNYKIANVSKTPGCTKWMGFLELPNLNIIDLPGYGYSKVAHGRQEFWDQMLLDYIKLKRTYLTFILIDIRKGICELDQQVMDLFKAFQTKIIYTKYDKETSNNQFIVSTKTGLGIIPLREFLTSL